MKLPDYIGIKDEQFLHYQINGYQNGFLITHVEVDSEEAVLDIVENFILRGLTFNIVAVSKVTLEYEDSETGEMKEFET